MCSLGLPLPPDSCCPLRLLAQTCPHKQHHPLGCFSWPPPPHCLDSLSLLGPLFVTQMCPLADSSLYLDPQDGKDGVGHITMM